MHQRGTRKNGLPRQNYASTSSVSNRTLRGSCSRDLLSRVYVSNRKYFHGSSTALFHSTRWKDAGTSIFPKSSRRWKLATVNRARLPPFSLVLVLVARAVRFGYKFARRSSFYFANSLPPNYERVITARLKRNSDFDIETGEPLALFEGNTDGKREIQTRKGRNTL